MCSIFWISPDTQQADTSFTALNFLFALCFFALRSRTSIFFKSPASFFLPLSLYCLQPIVHFILFLPPSSACPRLWNLSLPPFNVSLFISFLSSLPPFQFSVGSKGTHHVNIRHTSVLMSITTWLNMAECVRWIALWRSFCRETDMSSCMKMTVTQVLHW